MENINVFEIRALLAVIKEKSISAAAKKLNVTQPAISKLVMRVEENYRIKIFDRQKTPWKLTTVGEVFKERLNAIYKEHSLLLMDIDDIVTNKKGSLDFATMAYEDRYLLPDIFTKFYKEYPNFKINTFLLDSQKMEQSLIDRKIDFAHVLLPVKSSNITSIFLKEYEIIVCIPNKFLIDKYIKIPKENNLQEIDLSLFKKDPFILRQSKLGFSIYENYIFTKSNFFPDKEKLIEVSQYITGINLSNEGIGINFTLDATLNYIKKSNNVSYFKIKNIRPKQKLSIAYLKNRKLSIVEEYFLQIMQENIVN